MYELGDYPEEGEYILGTVKAISQYGALIALDEYGNKEGMLPLRQLSPKWVRNIRDYVKEGQKVVLKVLRVDPRRGHIDLSLMRVSDSKRKEKLMEVKQRQRAIKLLELLEEKTGTSGSAKEVYDELIKNFSDAYAGLENIAVNDKEADKLKIDKKLKSELITLIGENIKPQFVEITGFVELRSYAPDGVDKLKEALTKIEKFNTESELGVTYVSAPIYRIHVRADDYKTAENVLMQAADEGIKYIKDYGGFGEFHRELKKIS